MLDMEILLTVKYQQQLFADPRRIALLKAIITTGSLRQGAMLIGISYKTAWDAINQINQLAKQPLVISSTGGKGGGGAIVTAYGMRFIQLYELLTQMQTQAFNLLTDDNDIALDDILTIAAKLSLQSSARNQLQGSIEQIKVVGAVGTMQVLLNDKQTSINVSITQASINRLQLQVNKSILLLVKAPQIELLHFDQQHRDQQHRDQQHQDQQHHDAVNSYQCYVKHCRYDEIWCELTLALESGLLLYVTKKRQDMPVMVQVASYVDIHIDPENIIVATLI